MTFVAISDTHGYHRDLILPKADTIIHGGDFCNYGNDDHLHDFLLWYGELEYDNKILIAGNHDFFAADNPDKFKALLPEDVTYGNVKIGETAYINASNINSTFGLVNKPVIFQL